MPTIPTAMSSIDLTFKTTGAPRHGKLGYGLHRLGIWNAELSGCFRMSAGQIRESAGHSLKKRWRVLCVSPSLPIEDFGGSWEFLFVGVTWETVHRFTFGKKSGEVV